MGMSIKSPKKSPCSAVLGDEMETMMPWNGWFSRLLKDKLGDERYTALSNWAQFRPDDPHGLIGVPEHARTTTEGVPRIKGYRYPAPGSRPAVEIPTADLDSDPYNINYYSKDTRRNAKSTTFHIVGSDVTVEETKMLPNTVTMIEIEEGTDADGSKLVKRELLISSQDEQIGSPGNNGMFATGKSSYDPTGLRSTMQTNWAAMNASVEAHLPTQLCTYEWEAEQEEMLAKWEEQGLPVMPGRAMEWDVPEKRNIASW
ncbi:hypothetical protein TrRE_jg3973 [Triparma retinervis]|uniref:Uncharacterized protein n=1 Tax=Triparma retinervis TaxID=2557542 RepID=A0A9W7DRT3_9STRA|nr:hypothetical protein TrRE_jg3973 [Triparma retinervis]